MEIRRDWDFGQSNYGQGTLTYQGPFESRPGRNQPPIAEEGSERLKLIGHWDHRPGDARRDVELMADGTVRMVDWRGTWTLKSDRLTLRWPTKNNPDQAFIDEVNLNPKRTAYAGMNRQGVPIGGSRVAAAVTPACPRSSTSPQKIPLPRTRKRLPGPIPPNPALARRSSSSGRYGFEGIIRKR